MPSRIGVDILPPSAIAPNIAGVEVQYRVSAANGATAMGAWVATTAYVAGDTVTYASQSFIALQGNTGITPGSDSVNWKLLADASAWAPMALQPLSTTVYAQPVIPGVEYDIQVRYRMTDGSVTSWQLYQGHTVVGWNGVSVAAAVDTGGIQANSVNGSSNQVVTSASVPSGASTQVATISLALNASTDFRLFSVTMTTSLATPTQFGIAIEDSVGTVIFGGVAYTSPVTGLLSWCVLLDPSYEVPANNVYNLWLYQNSGGTVSPSKVSFSAADIKR